MKRTFYFEDTLDVSIDELSTIEEVDAMIEAREGKQLEVRFLGNNATVRGGNVFKIKRYNLDSLVRSALKKSDRSMSRVKD